MSKVGNVTFGLTAQVRSLYSWTWSVTGRYAAAIKIVGRRPNGPSQPGFFYPTNLVGVGHAPPDQFPPRKLSRAAGGKWIKCKVHRLIVRAPVSTGPASDLCSFLNIFYPPFSGFLTRPRSCLYHHDSWSGIFYHIAIPCTFDSVESLYIVERHARLHDSICRNSEDRKIQFCKNNIYYYYYYRNRVIDREEEGKTSGFQTITYARVLLRRFRMREDVHVAVRVRPRVEIRGHY